MSYSQGTERYGSGTIKRGTGTSSPDGRFCYSPRGMQVTNKLDHVSGKFTALYSDLENEKQQKRVSENERYAALKDRVDAVESNLQAEVARRYEADRALQSHIDTELTKLSERMALQFKELQMSLRGSLDHLGRTVNEINVAISEEREQRRADVDHVGTSLCARLDESVAAIEDERFARLEQERESLKRIGEDLYKINERVDCEKQCREQAVHDLGEEIREFVGTRSLKDEQFNSQVLEEMSTLRTKIGAESIERVQEDEAIVHAINEYTRAIQEGLRIVGSS